MADQEEPVSLASTFPNPPSFWKDFTPERIARIDELRKAVGLDSGSRRVSSGNDDNGDGQEGGGGGVVERLPGSLPDDLVTLQPPAEPEDGRWRVFGDQYNLQDELPTLEEQGITNLPAIHAQQQQQSQSQSQSQDQPSQPDAPSSSTPTTTTTTIPHRDAKHYDRALELKRFAKSLLLNFLELAGTLSRNPSHAQPKVRDLGDVLINMHHALNEYRPHQARESVIEMMQDHLDRTRRETAAVRTQVDRARRVLEGLGSLGIVAEGGGAQTGAGDGAKIKEEKEKEEDGEEEGAGDGAHRPVEEWTEEEWEKVALEREAEIWAGTNALFT